MMRVYLCWNNVTPLLFLTDGTTTTPPNSTDPASTADNLDWEAPAIDVADCKAALVVNVTKDEAFFHPTSQPHRTSTTAIPPARAPAVTKKATDPSGYFGSILGSPPGHGTSLEPARGMVTIVGAYTIPTHYPYLPRLSPSPPSISFKRTLG